MQGVSTIINWKGYGIDPVETIRVNLARVSGRFQPTPTEIKDEPVAVVAYGPTLCDTWQDLIDFRIVFTCSGAMKFLKECGIRPTYHVDSDPQVHKTRLLGTPHSQVTYLLASTIHGNYLDALRDHECKKVKLWHLYFREFDILDAIPLGEPMLTGGGNVGVHVIKLARLMGYVNLHLFGFDACTGRSGSHAAEHPNPESTTDLFSFPACGRTFTTCEDWITQGYRLLADLDDQPEITRTFHGDGLLRMMAATHTKLAREHQPLAFEKISEDEAYGR